MNEWKKLQQCLEKSSIQEVRYVSVVVCNYSIQQKTNALYEESEEVQQCLKEAKEKAEIVSLLRERYAGNPIPMTDQLQYDISHLQDTVQNSSELKKELEMIFDDLEVRLQKHLLIQRIEKEL